MRSVTDIEHSFFMNIANNITIIIIHDYSNNNDTNDIMTHVKTKMDKTQ